MIGGGQAVSAAGEGLMSWPIAHAASQPTLKATPVHRAAFWAHPQTSPESASPSRLQNMPTPAQATTGCPLLGTTRLGDHLIHQFDKRRSEIGFFHLRRMRYKQHSCKSN